MEEDTYESEVGWKKFFNVNLVTQIMVMVVEVQMEKFCNLFEIFVLTISERCYDGKRFLTLKFKFRRKKLWFHWT